MIKKFLMPVYYVIYFEELIPCYLIKEGYIPCKDYRKDENDDNYCAYARCEFCLSVSDKNIFTNKEEAIKVLIGFKRLDRKRTQL